MKWIWKLYQLFFFKITSCDSAQQSGEENLIISSVVIVSLEKLQKCGSKLYIL